MILPELYTTCLCDYLSEAQLLTLEILVWLLQVHKQVRIERLAACLPLPILYESRRRHMQRFLVLPKLSVPLVWFPLIKCILKAQIPPGLRLVVPLDRTQWETNNLLMVSVIWKKRAFPVYWQFLEKAGSSNLQEQIAVIRPVLKLLSCYEIVVVGDREFRSVELAYWLKKKQSILCFASKTGYLHSSNSEKGKASFRTGFSSRNEAFLYGSHLHQEKGIWSILPTSLLAAKISR